MGQGRLEHGDGLELLLAHPQRQGSEPWRLRPTQNASFPQHKGVVEFNQPFLADKIMIEIRPFLA
jgi:hypothetical protein